jgi:hypothetical protein
MRFPFSKGQRFMNHMNDMLEVIALTRYRVYYRITMPTGGVEYTAAFTFERFPATYIEGMLGKSEFTKAIAANRFEMMAKELWATEKTVPCSDPQCGCDGVPAQ